MAVGRASVMLPTPAVWTIWGVWISLLGLGVQVLGRPFVGEGGSGSGWMSRLLGIPVYIGILATVLLPANPTVKRFMEMDPPSVAVSRRQQWEILLLWSGWGILSGLLMGLYHSQAGSYPLFGAMYISAAVIGWCRFEGIIY